jgi:hypothetical protein
MGKNLSKEPNKLTASGILYTGKCIFQGFLLGTDGVNDPVVTIYNGVDNTGQEIVPTATYDASAYGLNGCTGINQYCDVGIYVEITCAGTVEVVVQHSPYYPDGSLKWRG